MNRTKFFQKSTVTVGTDSIEEFDYLYNNLSKLDLKYDPSYYRIDASDIAKGPGLISFRNYGTVRYWWVLCIINDIANILEDMTIGDIWKIPNQLDIYDFYKKYSLR